jgi:hypothetical protein
MANSKHLAIPMRGVHARNEWRRTHTEILPDLREADLTGTNLIAVKLDTADLSGASLRSARLFDGGLRGANLRRVSLIDASLHGADLMGGRYPRSSSAELESLITSSTTLARSWVQRLSSIPASSVSRLRIRSSLSGFTPICNPRECGAGLHLTTSKVASG